MDSSVSIINGQTVQGYSQEAENAIEAALELLNHDLACLDFVHVGRNELQSTQYDNGILFVPDRKTGGGSWSAAGIKEGWTNGNGPITQWGAKPTWQIISLTEGGSTSERTIQHEGQDLIYLPKNIRWGFYWVKERNIGEGKSEKWKDEWDP